MWDVPSHTLPNEVQAPQTSHVLLLTLVLVFEKYFGVPAPIRVDAVPPTPVTTGVVGVVGAVGVTGRVVVEPPCRRGE